MLYSFRLRRTHPAHSVFQAKNAYGGGYPWSAEHTRDDISYDLDQFPVAQRCIDSCMWNVNNHRPPNGPLTTSENSMHIAA